MQIKNYLYSTVDNTMKIKLLLFFVSILMISCINDTKPSKSSRVITNDSINKINESNAVPSSVKRRKEVFGFHPHWVKKSIENYDYKLLTSISYFAYDLDPEKGIYKTIRDWKTIKLIDSAKANNIKVYLTVANLSKDNNRIFLENKSAQEASIYTILHLLNTREAHGVTINFENVPCDLKNDYTSYIKNLSKRLKEFNKTVVITLPAIVTPKCFEILALNAYVEHFVVMAKDYYGSGSDVAGPVAPLSGDKLWAQGSIENTINSYLAEGLPKEKFILTLPHYGNKYQTDNNNVPAKNKKFIGTLSYKNIKNIYSQKAHFEPVSQSNYLKYKEDGKFIQVWFDDAKSLGEKYDYINSKELAGVGIWALGYDNGYTELWDVLNEKFGN